MNQTTRKQFLAMVYGPLEYGFDQALRASGHSRRDGWEQMVNMGRREWERRTSRIAA